LSYLVFAKGYFYLKVKGVFSGKKQIAIVLAEQFGDIVACEPIARKVRELHPTAIIYWVARKPFEALLTHNPHINSVWIEYSVLETILLLENNAFDQTYNLHLSNHRFSKYTHRSLNNTLAEQLGIDVANYFNFGSLLSVFSMIGGLPTLNERPRLYFPPQMVAPQGLPQKPFIVFHCQSNYAPKDWNVDNWNRLTNDILANTDIDIVEIGLANVLSIPSERYYNLCGRLSLLGTAWVIGKAHFYIGIDSGPAHFAAAQQTPALLLFGKLGAFDIYNPYADNYADGKTATIVYENGKPCADLPYDVVWNALQQKLIS
jgi:heptosyltransferase III